MGGDNMKKMTESLMSVLLFMLAGMTTLSAMPWAYVPSEMKTMQTSAHKSGEQVNVQCLIVGSPERPVSMVDRIETEIKRNSNGRNKEFYSKGTAKMDDKHVVSIPVTLNEPGVISVSVKLLDKDGNVIDYRNIGGVAFEPEKIVTSRPVTPDFAEYWKKEIQHVEDTVPLDLKCDRIAESNDKFTVYRISGAAPQDVRVYGFYIVPVGKGPFPLLINVPGAGLNGELPNLSGEVSDNHQYGANGVPLRAWPGIALLMLNVNLYDPYAPDKTPQALWEAFKKNPDKPHVAEADLHTPRDFWFYAPALGINRIINAIAERPEIRKDRIGYFGFSQGATMGLVLAGINPNIGRLVSHMPGMCNILYKYGEPWPFSLSHPNTGRQADYWDTAFFASQIKVPAALTAGLGDDCCLPENIFAAFNAIPVKEKTLHLAPHSHSVSMEYYQEIRGMINWLKQ